MMSSAAVDNGDTLSAQVGWGMYGNRAAVAVGLKARLNQRSSMSMGLTHDGRKAMGGIGFSFSIK